MTTTYTRALRAAMSRFFADCAPTAPISVVLTADQLDLLEDLVCDNAFSCPEDRPEIHAELSSLLHAAACAMRNQGVGV